MRMGIKVSGLRGNIRLRGNIGMRMGVNVNVLGRMSKSSFCSLQRYLLFAESSGDFLMNQVCDEFCPKWVD